MNAIILKIQSHESAAGDTVITHYSLTRDGQTVPDLEALQHGFTVSPESAPQILFIVQQITLAGIQMMAVAQKPADPEQN